MTSAEFIANVKRAASVPTAQATFQESDFLATANLEMQTYLFPLLASLREEFFLHDMDFAYVDGGRYRIPPRAMGGKLRDVKILVDGREKALPRVPLDNLDLAAYGFYIRGTHVHVIKMSTVPTLVRLVYSAQPNPLVSTTRATTVASSTASTITLASTPSVFGTPLKFDILKGSEPYEFLDEGLDRQGTLAAGVITITDGLGVPDDLEVGDYIALRYESPVIQYPLPVASLLVQRVAAKCLEHLGDLEGAQVAFTVLQGMEKEILRFMSNRSESDAPVIIPTNPLFRGQ